MPLGIRFLLLLVTLVAYGYAMPSCTFAVQLETNQLTLNQEKLNDNFSFMTKVRFFSLSIINHKRSSDNTFHQIPDISSKANLPKTSDAGVETLTPSPSQYRIRSKLSATSFSLCSFVIGSNEPTCSIAWSFTSRNF